MAQSLSAQHFLECDNCEENPSKFLCKSCPGYLCENCKIEHEKKKMTRSHEIVALTSHNEDMVDLLFCSNHAKKLECYCDHCKEPVCTDCIIQSHNGHPLKSLSTVYKELTDHYKQEREEIENVLLPRHRELLCSETAKRSAFTKRADELVKKIEAHTLSVIEMVKHVGQQTIESVREAEKEGLHEMNIFKDSLEEKINQLHIMGDEISACLEARPEASFFSSIYRNQLENFQSLPTPVECTLTDFQPENKDKEISLGKPPILQLSKCNLEKESYRPVSKEGDVALRISHDSVDDNLPEEDLEESYNTKKHHGKLSRRKVKKNYQKKASSAAGALWGNPGPLLQSTQLLLGPRTPPHWGPALHVEALEECAQGAPQDQQHHKGERRCNEEY